MASLSFRMIITYDLFVSHQMKGQTAPAPIRGLSKVTGDGEEDCDKEEAIETGADVVDLLPRTDIR